MAPRLPTLLHLEGVTSVLPHKRADNLIKLRRILQPHKVAAAFMHVEDLDPCPGDLLADPFLRLGVEEARTATEHQGGKSDPGNHIPPVLRAVIYQQASGIVARKLEVFREYPGTLLLREGCGEEGIRDKVLSRLDSLRATEFGGRVIERCGVEEGAGSGFFRIG